MVGQWRRLLVPHSSDALCNVWQGLQGNYFSNGRLEPTAKTKTMQLAAVMETSNITSCLCLGEGDFTDICLQNSTSANDNAQTTPSCWCEDGIDERAQDAMHKMKILNNSALPG